MDVDKSLDDIMADKRAANPRSAPAGRASGPRQSGGSARRDSPYARPPPRSADDKWVHDAYSGPAAGGGGRRGGDSYVPRDAVPGSIGFTGVSPRIEVTNIHYEVTPADLKGIFSQAGTLVQGPTLRLTRRLYQTRTNTQYDRSGRSLGVATMEYASPQQAKVAINKFDGAMTKGQTISIRLLAPIQPRAAPVVAGRGAVPQAQTGASLLARMGGAGGAGSGAGGPQRNGPLRTAPPVMAARARGGPVRGRGGAGAGGGGGRRDAKRGPATEGDLDKELDAFMKKDDVAME